MILRSLRATLFLDIHENSHPYTPAPKSIIFHLGFAMPDSWAARRASDTLGRILRKMTKHSFPKKIVAWTKRFPCRKSAKITEKHALGGLGGLGRNWREQEKHKLPPMLAITNKYLRIPENDRREFGSQDLIASTSNFGQAHDSGFSGSCRARTNTPVDRFGCDLDFSHDPSATRTKSVSFLSNPNRFIIPRTWYWCFGRAHAKSREQSRQFVNWSVIMLHGSWLKGAWPGFWGRHPKFENLQIYNVQIFIIVFLGTGSWIFLDLWK